MDALLLKAEDVGKALSIGRSKAYQMIANGDLPVVRIGTAVRVPVDGLRDWVAKKSQPADGAEA